jgi:membrane protease YdiL (CAAX protease family)
MNIFTARHPLAFSLLLVLVLFGLTAISTIVVPRTVVSTVENLPRDLRVPSSDLERALTALVSPENLFRVLEILLAIVVLSRLGWWGEVGFNRPSRWRNLHLLWFPLLIGALLPLLGGVKVPGATFLVATLLGASVAALGDEALFRGIMWRALVPTGLARAVVAASLLSGVLHFAGLTLARPWPEALLLAIFTTCGGFTYAALRWRTASIWPVVLLHFAFGFVGGVSTPGTVPYLVPLLFLAGTLGSLGYGLFLLRPPVRADGG